MSMFVHLPEIYYKTRKPLLEVAPTIFAQISPQLNGQQELSSFRDDRPWLKGSLKV